MLFCQKKISIFETLFQEHYQCQTVWIQIRPDKMLGLIWVQTVFKGHQQKTQTDTEIINSTMTDTLVQIEFHNSLYINITLGELCNSL